MTLSEAGDVDRDDLGWSELYCELVIAQGERWTLELREEAAFEEVFFRYRRAKFTWTEDGKRLPMKATQASIELAGLRIFAPRCRFKNVERMDKPYEPDIGDDHCWLQVAGRAWRIEAIESQVYFLDSFGDKNQLDVSRVKWDNYIEKAVAALRAAYPLTA